MRARVRMVWLVAPLALVAWSGPALAQLTAAGAASVSPPSGTAPVRWPDVAYDVEHDVFLAVSGAGSVAGFWLAGDGAPIDVPFAITDAGAFGQAPRVTYASGVGFVVAWHETLPGDVVRIRARVVPYGATPGATFDVSPIGTNWEMGAALAWSSASGLALVAWQSTSDTRIGAQRVDATGALVGSPIPIDPRALYFRDPAVVHHAASDTFFVAYAGCVGTDDCFVDVQRVDAGTGALVGGPIELDASIAAGYVPEVGYAERTGDVVAIWQRRTAGGASMQSRAVHADGSTGATTLVTDTLGAYDANGLAYASGSGTFVWVSHGAGAEDVAIELSSMGAPLGTAVPFGVASASGNFNPRVAARAGHAEWLAVTSTAFDALTAQHFTSATRDPSADAGAETTLDASGPDADAGTPVARDAGGADAGRARAVAAGCGCRADASRSTPVMHGAWLLVLVLVARRGR